MYTNEKINYTSYLRNKPQDTDPAKLSIMKDRLVSALRGRDVHGHISAVYYQDGCVKVSVNGDYCGVFDANTCKFFSGSVGDYK